MLTPVSDSPTPTVTPTPSLPRGSRSRAQLKHLRCFVAAEKTPALRGAIPPIKTRLQPPWLRPQMKGSQRYPDADAAINYLEKGEYFTYAGNTGQALCMFAG